MTTRSRRVLALLAVSGAALAGCGVGHDDHQAATPTPSTTVTPSPRPAGGAATGDQAYLQLLREGHWTVTDKAQIIRVAHAECQMRGQGTTNVALVGKVAAKYDITAEAARSQLSAAETTYCPEQLDTSNAA
jgi:hypothetical protein